MSEKRGKGLLESHGTSQTEGEKRSGWGLCTQMYQELKICVVGKVSEFSILSYYDLST